MTGVNSTIRLLPHFSECAPIQIDERLKTDPRHLPSNQREALINQLKRQKKRSENPISGFLIDIDTHSNLPKLSINICEFIAESQENIKKICDSIVSS